MFPQSHAAFESHEGWGNRSVVLKRRQNWASPYSDCLGRCAWIRNKSKRC
jgi:hypothetical protein